MTKFKKIALFGVALPCGLLALLFGMVEGAGIYIGNQRAHDESLAITSRPPKKDEPATLRKKLAAHAPRGSFLVIDTAKNLLYMKKGEELLQKAIISTGSGKTLRDPNSDKEWVFDTPRGVHTIKSKSKNPTWIKPDWAFIEDGEGPPKSFNDRVEEGVLGEYALGIGNGYFLHGTLYTRMLGKSVSHGCVRIGDEDLKRLYNEVPLGAKVYIF